MKKTQTDYAKTEHGQAVISTLFSAAILLFVGFWMSPAGIAESPMYNGSVALFTWAMRIGGAAMILVALAHAMRWLYSGLFDAALHALVGLVLACCGTIWILSGDFSGLLILLFSLLFFHTARGGWVLYLNSKRLRSAGASGASMPPTNQSQNVVPEFEGTTTEAKPSDGKDQNSANTPEGYLADLGRQQEE